MKIFLGRGPWNGIRVKHHYTVMGSAYSELVLCADHAERLHPAYLRLLYLEVLTEHRADSGKKHLLSCSHIRSPAHHLEQLPAVTGVQSGYVQMV